MKTFNAHPPIVLAFSAHDPSGAAGIQADIESINRNGARCVSVLTALTAQNTGTFETLLPQQPVNFIEQATMLLADINIDAFKIGLVGSAELVNIIADIVARYPEPERGTTPEWRDRQGRVINTLYRADTEPVHFDWDRLPGVYHGSGCTLAAAIAAQLAQHNDVIKAVTVAQQYCWQALAHGYPIGKHQHHPDRDFQE